MNAKTIDPAIIHNFTDGIQRSRWMGSPLYGELCRSILSDNELLSLTVDTPVRQSASHLLFAASHWLLLEDPSAPLGAYYASVTTEPRADRDGTFRAFRNFCLERRDEIITIINTRTVQFTLAGRAGFILPAIAHVARLASEPLSFIEIGCSAGLLTQFDRYSYDFGPAGKVGNPDDLTITSLRFLGTPPSFASGIPKIGQRVGIDLNPIDPSDPAERRWVDAFCPPDMVEERRQLRAALNLRARAQLPIITGDALVAVPEFLKSMPDPICTLAAHCLYQWPKEARDALDAVYREASHGRALYRVTIDHPAALDRSRAAAFIEPLDDEAPIQHEAILTVYRDGASSDTLLGRYDSFGRRATWLQGSH